MSKGGNGKKSNARSGAKAKKHIFERENLMLMLYQMDFMQDFSKAAYGRYLSDLEQETGMSGDLSPYFYNMYETITENMEEIDGIIESHSVKWKIGRMPRVDVSIMRIAVAELKFRDDIPPAIAVNEAVELAKKYSTDNSPRFINGLLAGVIKETEIREKEE